MATTATRQSSLTEMHIAPPPTDTATHYKYIILGAGCAGLSLCWYLLEAGVREPILILDRKPAFADDRTWCFWDTEPTPFTHLATHRWNTWAVHNGDNGTRASAPTNPYVRLRGSDFYAAVHARIAAHPNVVLRLGVAVTGGYRETETGVCVATAAGDVTGAMLFDATSLGSSRFPVARAGDITFLQQFFGQTVRTPQNVFDTNTVTLMDFGVPDVSGAIRFVYLLPLSPREALVENTVLLPGGGGTKDAPSPRENADAGRRAVAAHLQSRYGTTQYKVVGEEQGLIPMTTRAFPVRTGRRTFAIGLAGGAARPSSGYAFLRIQRSCRALATAVVRGGAVVEPSALSRTALLDRVFLQAMRRKPQAVGDYFGRLFARVPPLALVRLLSDTASVADCFAVVKALPLADFVRAAASCLRVAR